MKEELQIMHSILDRFTEDEPDRGTLQDRVASLALCMFNGPELDVYNGATIDALVVLLGRLIKKENKEDKIAEIVNEILSWEE